MRLFIILWCLTFSSFASGIIGDILLQTGNAVIERNDGEDVKAEDVLDTRFSSACIWIRCSKSTIPMKPLFKIMIVVECTVVIVALTWLLVVYK